MKIENDLAYTLNCLRNISAQILEISDAQKLLLIATYYDEVIPEMVISNVNVNWFI
jgi:hypothetical protein